MITRISRPKWSRETEVGYGSFTSSARRRPKLIFIRCSVAVINDVERNYAD